SVLAVARRARRMSPGRNGAPRRAGWPRADFGGRNMVTKVTRDVLEGYLHCKTKAHLELTGQQGSVSDYEKLLIASREEVRQTAIVKILEHYPENEVEKGIPLTVAALRAGPSFVLDATLEDGLVSLGFDGLKRSDGPSKLGNYHYIPMLFHEGRKIRKEQKLL